MLANENQACLIGYGGMLMESFVAIMGAGLCLHYRPGRLRDEQPDGGSGSGGHRRRGGIAAQVVSGWGLCHYPGYVIEYRQ